MRLSLCMHDYEGLMKTPKCRCSPTNSGPHDLYHF